MVIQDDLSLNAFKEPNSNWGWANLAIIYICLWGRMLIVKEPIGSIYIYEWVSKFWGKFWATCAPIYLEQLRRCSKLGARTIINLRINLEFGVKHLTDMPILQEESRRSTLCKLNVKYKLNNIIPKLFEYLKVQHMIMLSYLMTTSILKEQLDQLHPK